MNKIIEFLKGKKTYIQSGIALVVIALWMGGYIDEVTAAPILAMLGFGSAISLKAGIERGKK